MNVKGHLRPDFYTKNTVYCCAASNFSFIFCADTSDLDVPFLNGEYHMIKLRMILAAAIAVFALAACNQNATDDAVSSAEEKANDAATSVKDTANDAATAVGDATSDAVDATENAADDAADAIKDATH